MVTRQDDDRGVRSPLRRDAFHGVCLLGRIDGCCCLRLQVWLFCKATRSCGTRTWLGFLKEMSRRPDQRTESPWNGRMTGLSSILTSLSPPGDMGVVQKNTRRRHARNTAQLSRRRQISAKPVSLLRHQFLPVPLLLCPPPRRRPPALERDAHQSPHKSSAPAPLLKRTASAFHSLHT